jgi:hypothetical protein
MAKLWMTLTHSVLDGQMDEMPKIGFLHDEETLLGWLDDQVIEDLIQFYLGDDSYDGVSLEPYEEVRELIEVVNEGESTLFTDITDARKKLLQKVRDHLEKTGSWEHITRMGVYDSACVGIYKFEPPETT